MDCYVIWDFAENKDGAKQFLIDYVDDFARGVQGERVLQLPLLPADRSRPRATARQRSEGGAPRQVQGSRERPRLGDQRRLPRLRDRRHRRGVQHVRLPDDVRQGRAGRDDPGGRPRARPRRRSSASSTSGSRVPPMAVVETRGLTKVFAHGSARRGRRRRSREPRRRVPRPPRPFGLREDDAPAHDRRSRGADLGRDPDRRRRRQRPDAPRAPDRDGLPELRALSAPDGPRQHRLSAQGAGGRAARSARRRRSGPRASSGSATCSRRKPRELSGGERQRVALARAIVREPSRLPARRAAVEPRREAARLRAGGAGAVPAARSARR